MGPQLPGRRAWGLFHRWLSEADPTPGKGYGNGSAMRVSAIGWAFDDLESVILEARKSATVTLGHPEGIRGAKAVATAVFVARMGQGKDGVRALLTHRFG